MHEFDLYISKKITNLKREKILIEYKSFQKYKKFLFVNYMTEQEISWWKTTTKKCCKFNVLIFQKLKSFQKWKKMRQARLQIEIYRKKTTKIIYNRYNNNWIMLTNYNFYETKKLRNNLVKWFEKILGVNLNKIFTVNLLENKINYLGITLSSIPCKVKKIYYKNNIKAKKKMLLTPFVGIDHQYIRSKLLKKKIITPKLKPSYYAIYRNLQPLQILEKFAKKFKILLNYYYNIITRKSNLNYYYYIYKFSFLKTLAYKMKKSITYISMIYLNQRKLKKYKKTIHNFLSYPYITTNKIRKNKYTLKQKERQSVRGDRYNEVHYYFPLSTL